MLTLVQALAWANQECASHTEIAYLDVAILLADVLQCSRAYLIAHPEYVLTKKEQDSFQQYIARRKQGEPIAYLIGRKEFWSLDFQVTLDTLIPRPETELLVELMLKLFPDNNGQIADLGTGCGAVAIAFASERELWHIHATDQSSQALQIASQNARQHGITNIQFHQGSWFEAFRSHPALMFNAIVSNPPYLSVNEWENCIKDLTYEPSSALVSGCDGLKAIREIIANAKRYLFQGGYLLLEHGSSQAAAVRGLLEKEGYHAIQSYRDLAGMERVTGGQN